MLSGCCGRSRTLTQDSPKNTNWSIPKPRRSSESSFHKGWLDDYEHWILTDRDMLLKVNALIADTRRTPYTGLGKPEPLRQDMAGWWARRITKEHRLVCRVEGKAAEQRLEIAACRRHYRNN